MVGEMYGAWQWVAAPLSVKDPSHWLWRGAGVDTSTMIPGVYSGEVDNRGDKRSLPAGVAVVSGTMTENHDGDFKPGESTMYTASSGATVFSAGSIKWANALAGVGAWDPRIQQATANLFSMFAGDRNLPAAVNPMVLPGGAPAPKFRGGVQVQTLTQSLTKPLSVAAAPNGDAIVVDDQRILRVTPAGSVSVVAGNTWSGFADGPASSALFADPHGVAAGSDGTIYVADTRNNRIRVISGGTVQTMAGSSMGFADGKGTAALFTWPMGITLTTDGKLLVADTWNFRIREVCGDGTVRTWAGTGARGLDGGPGSRASLTYPMSMAALPNGEALFMEPESGMIRKVSGATTHEVSVLLGNLGVNGWADGSAISAQISETIAAAVRADGQMVFLDGASARVRALRNGVVDTLAGGLKVGTLDGAGDAAGFSFPRALAVAPDGSILVVDLADHALRRITLQ
jgi:glucose/arabinose dehydrogenase